MKVRKGRTSECNGVVVRMMGMGSRIITSMSKIRNRTAKRKNRNEKGMRDFLGGSNPHSNGDIFSRSWVEWKLNSNRGNARVQGIRKAREKEGRVDIIERGRV
jgi:hypothetical protein